MLRIRLLTLAPCLRAGTQTVWASLMQIPNSVLNAATGVPESTFSELKKYPLVIAPGTGGESCLKKCNLDFKTVSARCVIAVNPPPVKTVGLAARPTGVLAGNASPEDLAQAFA